MTLLIHRANRADRLARGLAEVLAVPLSDPFASEIVAVPTRGVERWLAQQLSHRLGVSADDGDGVCAGVDFVSTRRLTAVALAAVADVNAEQDPWRAERAVWPLLTVVDAARGEPWAQMLWGYLKDPAAGRRWSTARHLSELFASYAGSRPEMVNSWLHGDDVDAAGHRLAPEFAWQAELWRRLRAELSTPGPAERLAAACARLVDEPAATDLPPRLSVFGVTRMSTDTQRVLVAVAAHRDVHLWLPHPSPALWDRVADRLSRTAYVPGPRSGDITVGVPRHPLLAYLGRDSRELQLTLSASGGGLRDVKGDAHAPLTISRHTLLTLLQDDLAADRAVRALAERPLLEADDRSLTLHSSHGPDRQVEVLRELLLGMLADDETLEPRDIVVMCPDIETFAPLISASFGLETPDREIEHPGHRLRVRLADRSLRQVNPLLSVLSSVLALADSRVEASVLLDLFASQPVAAKFGFTEDDLDRLRDLVRRSGVRWGLDADQRQQFEMGQFAQNTWAAGLDRLLLGVTMDETGQKFIGTALPLDDVDSADVDLVGRIAECVARVRQLVGQLSHRRGLADWVGLCRNVLEMLTDVGPADSWQVSHAYAALATLTETSSAGLTSELTLTDIRALLADTFRGRASRANFRTGTLTMCTMLPMRSIPHRVICLLGVDEGVFPRHSSIDGDDILAAEPWIGDRDPRSEDRQLLLDAIMAAEERLVVVYSGADPRTRAPKPPAVPIGALLDTLDQTARTRDGRSVRDQITTRHPLQPFDAVNFVESQAASGGHAPVSTSAPAGAPGAHPFSFDQASLRGARAAARPRAQPEPVFGGAPLGPAPLGQVIALADLVRFLSHPVKALLRTRGGIFLTDDDDQVVDQMPVSLDGLESWAIGDRLLKLSLAGADLDALAAAEWRRGSLPPRTFGSRLLTPLTDTVRLITQQALPYLSETQSSRDVLVAVGTSSLTGTLSAIHGSWLVSVTFSRLAAKHRLQAWVELLALSASHPGTDWQAVTIGNGRRSVLGPVDSGYATRVLNDVADLMRVGLCEPIPFSPKASCEYARIRFEGKSVSVLKERIERMWAQDRDTAYEAFFGMGASLDRLQEQPSQPDEERGDLAEQSRFGTLARRVWHPLLTSEVLE